MSMIDDDYLSSSGSSTRLTLTPCYKENRYLNIDHNPNKNILTFLSHIFTVNGTLSHTLFFEFLFGLQNLHLNTPKSKKKGYFDDKVLIVFPRNVNQIQRYTKQFKQIQSKNNLITTNYVTTTEPYTSISYTPFNRIYIKIFSVTLSQKRVYFIWIKSLFVYRDDSISYTRVIWLNTE